MTLFTLEQIDDLHQKLGNIKDFGHYVAALRLLGVEKYESYLTDGHSEYYGADGYHLSSEPVHEVLSIADTSDRDRFLEHLALHEAKKTDYFTMSRGLAASGIEKWAVDTRESTMTYYDKQGNKLLVETIA